GSAGLAFYLVARASGFNLTVVPESLPDVWWKFPVLILSAAQNSVVEEVIVVAYLLRRLDQLGWTPMASLAASSVLRGSYHLYQGIGGFIGNLVM
ncbi:CPBP family intramembrane metalloprotease, partial [Streptomyces sp. SID8455]|nr:CPBP family intramembrane metalloprotease [Streptomyces sp. SID8455]